MADHDAGQRGGGSPRQAMALNDSASALSAVDPTAPIDWVVNTWNCGVIYWPPPQRSPATDRTVLCRGFADVGDEKPRTTKADEDATRPAELLERFTAVAHLPVASSDRSRPAVRNCSRGWTGW